MRQQSTRRLNQVRVNTMPVFGARAVETGHRASAESLRLGESGDTGRQQGADGESGRTLSAMAE